MRDGRNSLRSPTLSAGSYVNFMEGFDVICAALAKGCIGELDVCASRNVGPMTAHEFPLISRFSFWRMAEQKDGETGIQVFLLYPANANTPLGHVL